MFKEINHARTDAIIDLIRTLPELEQTVIARGLSAAKPKKKLSEKEKREKRKQSHLKGIAEGLREIQEAKRGGKPMKTLDEFLDEL
jgi:hypothetical protein